MPLSLFSSDLSLSVKLTDRNFSENLFGYPLFFRRVLKLCMLLLNGRLRLYKRWPCSTYILKELTEWSVMSSARFLSHMNHVSVSPTNGNGPTQGQRNTLNRVGIEPTTFGLDLRRSTD